MIPRVFVSHLERLHRSSEITNTYAQIDAPRAKHRGFAWFTHSYDGKLARTEIYKELHSRM